MFDLKVTYTDGRVAEYPKRTSDSIRWEEYFGIPASRFFATVLDESGAPVYEYDNEGNKVDVKQDFKAKHLWYYAYLGAKRCDGEERDFEVWMDDVDSIVVMASTPKDKPSTRKRSPSQ